MSTASEYWRLWKIKPSQKSDLQRLLIPSERGFAVGAYCYSIAGSILVAEVLWHQWKDSFLPFSPLLAFIMVALFWVCPTIWAVSYIWNGLNLLRKAEQLERTMILLHESGIEKGKELARQEQEAELERFYQESVKTKRGAEAS